MFEIGQTPSNDDLEATKVGDWLAEDGLLAGTWENRYVSAIARELLAARKKLAKFGLVWDGEDYKFNGRDL